MHITSKVSQHTDIKLAIAELTDSLDAHLLSTFVIYYTENYDTEMLYAALQRHLPTVPFIGCSSSKGIMTEKGFFKEPAIALMAIYDDGLSAYGTGFKDLNNNFTNIKDSVAEVIEQALITADRVGEVPSLIILHSTPGYEEQIITHIDETFGALVPIVGGSSAVTSSMDTWSVISDKSLSNNGIALSLLFPSKSVSSCFSAGYSPTEFKGTITKCNQRIIHEIDDKPANTVYRNWIETITNKSTTGLISFEQVTEFPLGRIAGNLYGQPYYKLTHPYEISDEPSLRMFSDFKEGDEVTLMIGSKEQLINRASRVIKEANAKNYTDSLPLGAILFFCAGAISRLCDDDILRVNECIHDQLHGQQFICPFTYGEQGRFIGGQIAHGNLMISAVILYESE